MRFEEENKIGGRATSNLYAKRHLRTYLTSPYVKHGLTAFQFLQGNGKESAAATPVKRRSDSGKEANELTMASAEAGLGCLHTVSPRPSPIIR